VIFNECLIIKCVINNKNEHSILYEYLRKISSILVFLSFTGIFGLLFYFSMDIKLNFIYEFDMTILETLFIALFFVLTIILLFSYHFINIIKKFTKFKLLIALIIQSINWGGMYLSAFIWTKFITINRMDIVWSLIIIFLIDVILFSIPISIPKSVQKSEMDKISNQNKLSSNTILIIAEIIMVLGNLLVFYEMIQFIFMIFQ